MVMEGMNTAMWKRLWRDESGQDFTEYALLLAFISLTTAALIIGPANSINSMWTTENSELSAAASTVTSR
jgi:Flp pilus assembly pilin Flp